jgi:signal transduction histidine kinase
VKAAAESRPAGIGRFRLRLLLAMMVVIALFVSLGIYFADRRAAQVTQDELRRDFQLELDALHRLEDLRYAAVADRSNSFAQNSRIHAALEDNALDLLYPSAEEELRDLLTNAEGSPNDAAGLHALFYRFLDGRGEVLAPPAGEAGTLLPNEQAALAQKSVPQTIETGYLPRRLARGGSAVSEIIAVPIRSTEDNEVIATLVLGFQPLVAINRDRGSGMKSGILTAGKLQLPDLGPAAEARLAGELQARLPTDGGGAHSFRTTIDGRPQLLFFKRLNPRSHYPPAYEVCLYPLKQLLARERTLRGQILGAGGILLLGGFVASHFLARRLSRPVEKLAVVSEENRAQRQKAEAQLQTTSEELQRSARFSADASHQLKSPITVLRAGLDSLLTREGFSTEVYEEIETLIHQTYRLTGVVEDLLLLSRMDAGKLRLNLRAVDLSRLVAEWLDDLATLPEAAELKVESDLPNELLVAGEKKYTAVVVENLLDNARKYNYRDGRIRIRAWEKNRRIELRVANTGRGIPAEAQPHVFERFHRAAVSNDVAGHGLGLNLARELLRLHGGDLRLVRSDAQWTEFAALFATANDLDGVADAAR